jgi:CheY-like chemotaxis protein
MSRRVVVADDEPDVRLVLRMRLQRAGWTVDEADSGEAAVARCRTQPVDAVVLDQRMGGMTGLEAASTLLREGFAAPIAIFSAYLTPEVEEEARRLGLTTVGKAQMGELAGILEAMVNGELPRQG